MSGSRSSCILKKPKLISKPATLKPTITFLEAVSIIVGLVIGARIFETPALVAANAGNDLSVLLLGVECIGNDFMLNRMVIRG